MQLPTNYMRYNFDKMLVPIIALLKIRQNGSAHEPAKKNRTISIRYGLFSTFIIITDHAHYRFLSLFLGLQPALCHQKLGIFPSLPYLHFNPNGRDPQQDSDPRLKFYSTVSQPLRRLQAQSQNSFFYF